MTALLPPEFAEFERFERRLATPMDELVEFHDAFLPRLDDAIEHCDRFPLDDLPEDAGRLLQLVHSLVMVSMAVEIFHQPKTVDAADAVILRIREPSP